MPSAVSITIKNYRCFTDNHPATVDLGPGFTAFVGPNNSGKSAYLKFFYEFHNLWGALNGANIIAHFRNNPDTSYSPGGLRAVIDAQEVLSDHTGRAMGVDVRLSATPASEPYLKSVSLTADANNPTAWRGKVSCGPTECTGLRTAGVDLVNETGHRVWWTPFSESFASLAGCMFAPAFRNAINEGSGSHYDLAVGTSLVNLWNQWKAGNTRSSKIAIQRITNDIRHIFGFHTLEINASADGKTLEVVTDGRPYRLNDLGAGISQFIILFANIAIRRPTLLLLDEPELNLHPSLQIDFLTSLASYTSTGSVVFATHSLGLARATADRIFTFTPGADGTAVSAFEQTPNYAEFAGEMSFSSFRELGFSTILMVEGPSEVKAVQQLLRLLGRDHEIVVLHLGGSSTICAGRESELGELRRLTTAVGILIDSEKASTTATLERGRQQFLADCAKLGFKTLATEKRAFENYLPDRAIKKVMGPGYRALTDYERLKDVSPAWSKMENWRIAREMTKDELLTTDVGKFLASL